MAVVTIERSWYRDRRRHSSEIDRETPPHFMGYSLKGQIFLIHFKVIPWKRSTLLAAVRLIDVAAEQSDQLRAEIVDKLFDYKSTTGNVDFDENTSSERADRAS